MSPPSTFPRPLVAIGSKKRNRDESSSNDELLTLIKMNILQEQQLRQDYFRTLQEQREEERKQREEYRRKREEELRMRVEERKEEKERREAENRRHE